MAQFIWYNGNIVPATTPIAGSANRGLRYGDGLFETMRVLAGEIRLESFHYDRLFKGLSLLKFRIPGHCTTEFLTKEILDLCERNDVTASGRVRLNVFRKDGGLYDEIDHRPNIIIETTHISHPAPTLREAGIVIDIFNDARKACDQFSNLKSNNYLPYTMGALYAKEHGFDDCLLLNAHARICDSTISNIFWLQNGELSTPPLSEGCVEGVMRRHLLTILPLRGVRMTERPLEVATLLDAEEIFLTNATGVRWVQAFREKKFSNRLASEIYALLA